jgi:hypothetical protein
MQLVSFVFISCYVLYVFRVLFAPILGSILKLYVQSSVQSFVDVVSGPVAGRWERLARVVAKS